MHPRALRQLELARASPVHETKLAMQRPTIQESEIQQQQGLGWSILTWKCCVREILSTSWLLDKTAVVSMMSSSFPSTHGRTLHTSECVRSHGIRAPFSAGRANSRRQSAAAVRCGRAASASIATLNPDVALQGTQPRCVACKPMTHGKFGVHACC